MEQDLIHYLKGKANCNATDISFFVQSFKGLMSEETAESFDQVWSALKDKHHFECNKTVLNYFENKLLPTFKSHSSIWVLKGAGIEKSELGITNNPSESINAVLHALQNWKQVPLDVICLSLLYLSHFYHHKIQRGIH